MGLRSEDCGGYCIIEIRNGSRAVQFLDWGPLRLCLLVPDSYPGLYCLRTNPEPASGLSRPRLIDPKAETSILEVVGPLLQIN